MTKIFRLNTIQANMNSYMNSGGFLRHKAPDRNSDMGFSLLEILVVLAIMGLLLSVTSVRMFSMIESTQFIRGTELALSDLKAHRAEALLEKHPVLILTDTPDPKLVKNIDKNHIRKFEIDTRWTVQGAAVFINAGGVCRGGPITFKDGDGREISYTLASPNCQAERIIEP